MKAVSRFRLNGTPTPTHPNSDGGRSSQGDLRQEFHYQSRGRRLTATHARPNPSHRGSQTRLRRNNFLFSTELRSVYCVCAEWLSPQKNLDGTLDGPCETFGGATIAASTCGIT